MEHLGCYPWVGITLGPNIRLMGNYFRGKHTSLLYYIISMVSRVEHLRCCPRVGITLGPNIRILGNYFRGKHSSLLYHNIFTVSRVENPWSSNIRLWLVIFESNTLAYSTNIISRVGRMKHLRCYPWVGITLGPNIRLLGNYFRGKHSSLLYYIISRVSRVENLWSYHQLGITYAQILD